MTKKGVKAQARQPKDAYSAWRRDLGDGCYANDVDWVEWRLRPDGAHFVAIIEATFYDDIPAWRHKLPAYRAQALLRFKRDGQYRVTRAVGQRLGAPAYFVVMRRDLAYFHVCNLATEEWVEMDEAGYRGWLKAMR